MQSTRSFNRVELAISGMLACIMPLIASPVMAANAPLPLTPFKIVGSDGMCVTVGTLANPDWQVMTQPCGAFGRQTFYVLTSGPDNDFVLQGPPQVPPARIVLADTFDNPTQGAYNYFTASAGGQLNVKATDGGALKEMLFAVIHPATVAAWTTVATQNQNFGIAGQRTLRYGPGTNGQYASRTLQGIDPGINASGQCNDAFFPNVPAGGTKTCAVQGAVQPYKPLQVQFRSSASTGSQCMVKLSPGIAFVGLGSCTPGATNVWTLQPTAYPGQP